MELNRDTYDRVLASYQELEGLVVNRVAEIGQQYRPEFRSHHIQELTKGTVWVEAYWPDYETGIYSFPTDWLFATNWEELVAAQRTEEARKLAEQKRMLELQQERIERHQYERLKAKFGGKEAGDEV